MRKVRERTHVLKKTVLMAKKQRMSVYSYVFWVVHFYIFKVLGKRGERDGSVLKNTSGSPRGHRSIPRIHVTAHNCL